MANVFKWEPHKRILFFITQGGHLSGDLMKSLAERNPQVLLELHQELAKDNSIGRYFTLENDRYGFLIVRKHYNTKPNAAEFMKMLGSLPKVMHKTTLETHPVYAKVLQELQLADVEIYETSLWMKE